MGRFKFNPSVIGAPLACIITQKIIIQTLKLTTNIGSKMSQLDQFESVFRSAIKENFVYQPLNFTRAMVFSDLQGDQAEEFANTVYKFLAGLKAMDKVDWHLVQGDQFNSTTDVLEIIETAKPELICTYRNLHSKAWNYPHSLGQHLDVLLQRTSSPVLVLPHPDAGYASDHALQNLKSVMAVTSHIANDHRLVNHAVAFTEPTGKLYLMHIESQWEYSRYIDAISKIPTIDTDDAAKRIKKQLLKEPHQYIGSCKNELQRVGVDINIDEMIYFGDRLQEYQNHIDEHNIDLLVMNTKDQDQSAMHGLAYPLAIELRQIPILML